MMAGEKISIGGSAPATVAEETAEGAADYKPASLGVKALITDTSLEGDGVTWYVIAVTDDGHQSTCKKRYSHFKELDEKLRRNDPTLDRVLPQLPETGALGFRHMIGDKKFEANREAG